ncbi:hypothetical protein [Streptomyces sp. NPDC005423]|uniref:hypothetical protein n=1 Tax=Streptomyces sp. NPDC005423 TaxID=3155343 RepID=UPI0033AE3B11
MVTSTRATAMTQPRPVSSSAEYDSSMCPIFQVSWVASAGRRSPTLVVPAVLSLRSVSITGSGAKRAHAPAQRAE